MIFVTVGSQDKQFNRLFNEIDKLINVGIITEKVIAQIGCNKVKNNQIEKYKMLSQKKFEELIKNSSLVITHGGVGSIVDALKKNKKVIAVPRKKTYKECANDHQIQIISAFANEGYIIGLKDVTELEDALIKVNDFVPKKLICNNSRMIKIIKNYIDDL